MIGEWERDIGKKWISVKDELPPDARKVLVCSNSSLIGCTFHDGDKWQGDIYNEDHSMSDWIDISDPASEFNIECKSEDITHWMYLPEGP